MIANRGEIALSGSTCCLPKSFGVKTVAIFSEADRESLHVRQADEAFCVGPGPVPRSYLNIPNIISTALVTGCDAIHPGYGFLAENARFAEICADHGLTFIGPKPAVIASMGDKATAKRVMKDAGVATTPGTDILDSVDAAVKAAKKVGYPVILKATAGGGGKGMRVVERPEERWSARTRAQPAEAEASFKRRPRLHGKTHHQSASYRGADRRQMSLRSRRALWRARLFRAKALAPKTHRRIARAESVGTLAK